MISRVWRLKRGVARQHDCSEEVRLRYWPRCWERWRKEPYRFEGFGDCFLNEKSSVYGPSRDRGPWPGEGVGRSCSSFVDGLGFRLSVRIRSHFAKQIGRKKKCADDGYDEGDVVSWKQSGSESGNENENGRRRLGIGLGTGTGIGSEIETASVSVKAGGCEIGCSWHLGLFQWAWLVQALLGPLKRREKGEPDLNG